MLAHSVLRQIHVGFGQDLTDAASNRTFPLWGSNILLFDPRGMIGCNVYAPPEEVKTPYSIRYEVIGVTSHLFFCDLRTLGCN